MKDIDNAANIAFAELMKLPISRLKSIIPTIGTEDLINLLRTRHVVGVQELCRRELFSRLEHGDMVLAFGAHWYTVDSWTPSGKAVRLVHANGVWGWSQISDFAPATEYNN